MHSHMYAHIYIHISTYMYISTCMHTHIQADEHTYIHAHSVIITGNLTLKITCMETIVAEKEKAAVAGDMCLL